MQNLIKGTYKRILPAGARVVRAGGKLVAQWVGRGGRKKQAEACLNDDGTYSIKCERSVWTARFRDADGFIVSKSTGCRNRESAQVRLAEFVREAERVAAGIVTTEELDIASFSKSSITAQVEEYIEYLTRRGKAAKRIRFTKSYLLECADGCNWETLGGLNADDLQRYLDDKHETKIIDGEKIEGASAGALNSRIECWVAFGHWLAGKRMNGKRANYNGERRIASNPFDGFARYDANIDRRRTRRALSEDELRRLLTVAEGRPLASFETIRRGKRRGERGVKLRDETRARLILVGRERALIYKTLVLTGLRISELASISILQAQLDGDSPHIKLSAADEKNRKGSLVPIRSDLAVELRNWIDEKLGRVSKSAKEQGEQRPALDEIKVFDVPSGLLRILNRDLTAAGIPKVDERGHSVDVHAMRTTFCTWLSTAEVAPRTTQAAMRHSNLRLTMENYTDPKLLNVRSAIERLPKFDAMDRGPSEPGTEVAPICTPSCAQKGDQTGLLGEIPDNSLLDSEPPNDKQKTLENKEFASVSENGRYWTRTNGLHDVNVAL